MGNAKSWEAELSNIEAVAGPDGRTLRALLIDARQVAQAEASHWHTAGQPGLGDSRCDDSGGLLNEIIVAVERAHNDYIMAVDLSDGELTPRAHFVLAEIAAALEFLFVSETGTIGHPRLERLGEIHGAEPDTPFALALKLVDYAALAAPHRTAMANLGGFDAALIDEAAELALALRERGPVGMRSDEAQRALEQRNRLTTLLIQKVAHVRSKASFVFRNHPEILREFACITAPPALLPPGNTRVRGRAGTSSRT